MIRAAAFLKRAVAFCCWIFIIMHGSAALAVVSAQAAASHSFFIVYFQKTQKDFVVYQKILVLPWVITIAILVVFRCIQFAVLLLKTTCLTIYRCSACKSATQTKSTIMKQEEKHVVSDSPPMGPSKLDEKVNASKKKRRSYAIVHNFTKQNTKDKN